MIYTIKVFGCVLGSFEQLKDKLYKMYPSLQKIKPIPYIEYLNTQIPSELFIDVSIVKNQLILYLNMFDDKGKVENIEKALKQYHNFCELIFPYSEEPRYTDIKVDTNKLVQWSKN